MERTRILRTELSPQKLMLLTRAERLAPPSPCSCFAKNDAASSVESLGKENSSA